MMEGITGAQEVQPKLAGLDLSSSMQEAPKADPVSTAGERIFNQSEVNDIVKKVKNSAVDDYKRLHTEQPEYAQRKYGSNEPEQQNQTQPQNSSNNLNENHYRKIAAEEAHRLRDEWTKEATSKAENEYANKIVQNFWNKVTPARDKYEDFDSMTGDIELNLFPNVVQLLAEYVDNSGEMLYEFGKDRLKMAQLEQLAQISPKDAIKQAQRLSQSLKDNHSAQRLRTPNEPMSQMRPSNSGTENGVLSVRDLRLKYKG